MLVSPLPVSFYDRTVIEVARGLLGARLVRLIDGKRAGGFIIETEAYLGEADLACHARAGRTPRTEVMYGMPGKAYIYFIYGMHWMLNVVAEGEGHPAAVLIRAIAPSEGLEQIAARRAKAAPLNAGDNGTGTIPRSRSAGDNGTGSIPRSRSAGDNGTGTVPSQRDWTNGPARLCQALEINGRLNGVDLTDPHGELVIEAGKTVAEEQVIVGPRVGIDRVPEPWRSMPWRFRMTEEGGMRAVFSG